MLLRMRMHGRGVALHVLMHGSGVPLHVLLHGNRSTLHVLLHGSRVPLHVLLHGAGGTVHVLMHGSRGALQVRRQVLRLWLVLGRRICSPHLLVARHCSGTAEDVSTQHATNGRRMWTRSLSVRYCPASSSAHHSISRLVNKGLGCTLHSCSSQHTFPPLPSY